MQNNEPKRYTLTDIYEFDLWRTVQHSDFIGGKRLKKTGPTHGKQGKMLNRA